MAPYVEAVAPVEAVPPALETRAVTRLLDELAAVLIDVSMDAYVANPLEGISGSIGQHVRHVLDHVQAFVEAGAPTPLSYDRRERGTPVERDPSAARRVILRLHASLDRMSPRDPDEPLQVVSVISASEPEAARSTLGRELAFVVNHTTHHHAMIALLLAFQGLEVPERLGYSPSTPPAPRA